MVVLAAAMLGSWGRAADVLENDRLRAEFDGRGLTAVLDKATHKTVKFAEDGFAVFVGDQAIDSEFAALVADKPTETTRAYRAEGGGFAVRVVYELKPGWGFVSKQLFVSTTGKKDFRVGRIEMFRGKTEGIAEQQRIRDGVLWRFGDGKPTYGMFVVLQNPFLQLKQRDGLFSLAYSPNMEWKVGDGAFESDRLCLGMYGMSGVKYAAGMVPEWKYIPGAKQEGATIDMAEVDSLVECVRAFLLYRPTKSIRVHIPWCENDYQIDVAKPEGREEYKRIIERAAEMGCQYVLYTPANSELAPLRENRDAWGWENLLWMDLGQKIRKGQWDPAKDAVPGVTAEMLEFAKTKGVKLMAYVYPSLPFMQKPEWTSWVKGQPGGYLGADTGQRSFQDWLVDKLVGFSEKTGGGGYSFDHWWIAYDETPSSHYAQWYGCRRILHDLRRRSPNGVIDGRQQYHYFGVWTWLAGSYPHPLNSDEQPASFKAFPDLRFDRVSADRQRYISWWYRMHCFVPPEIMPGYIGHQTQRNEPGKGTRRDRFRATDWDILGWRYSLLSSIASAPFNHVVNMIPARDMNEYRTFPEADKKWFRDWLDFTDRNAEILRNVKPIIGQPMVGRVDGWAAFKGERGFVFLFNPNYRALEAEFALDRSIGLKEGKSFVIRQLYPDAEKGKVIGNSKAFWEYGRKVSLAVPGTDVVVLEVEAAPERIEQPVLFNVKGSVSLRDEQLEIQDAIGEVGRHAIFGVQVPAGAVVKRVRVNGKTVSFAGPGGPDNVIGFPRAFAGAAFARCQQIGKYDPAFAGGTYRAEIEIPQRVFKQLEQRKKAWPIAYTQEDLLATWLGANRLLLFVNMADPADSMKVSLKIDGKAVEVKPAYSSVYRENERNTFVGWYADVSDLAADRVHQFEVELPKLAPGQFQGLFLENVEAEYTNELAGNATGRQGIRVIDPPEQGFYSMLFDYDGIPIKAHKDVADEALVQARERLGMMMDKLPTVRANLKAAGAELHVIGKDQVTSDLPEHRHLKGKPFDGNLTVDERTRGLGGILVSCGEENLLRLEKDRYRGRDICVHEFAHCIYGSGIPRAMRQRFREQMKRSMEKGLWVDSYAGSNDHEFFAELTMWYFGTHGDLHMKGKKPGNGREGLREYDAEACALFEDFYSGKMDVPSMKGTGK